MREAMKYKLPPLPEWSKMDNLGWLVPSEIRQELRAYAIAAIEAQGAPDHCDPSCTSYDLAAMVMSDCGHSTNNQRLLDRIAARIDKHVESLLASAPPAPQQKPLTDEQINQMWSDAHNDTSPMSLIHVLVRAVEAAHNIGEKK